MPTLAQLHAVSQDFAQLVRTSLANERLLELPTAPEVEQALAERGKVAAALDKVDDPHRLIDLTIRYNAFDPVIFAAEDQQEARQVLRDRLWNELSALDYRSVAPFIGQAARARDYRIDPDSPPYRQLAHLLLKAWIGELDQANDVFVGLDQPIRDQDEALTSWSASTVPLLEVKGQPSMAGVPAARDIKQLFGTYLREKFPRIARNALQDKERTIQQFTEVAGLKDIAMYRKTDVTAYKHLLIRLPLNVGRDYAGKTMQQIIELTPAETKRLAAKTVRSRLAILGSFGRWLSENVDGVDASNFRTTAPVSKRPETPVREFSDSEIRAIFHAPLFTGCASERNQLAPGTYRIRDYRYWLPLLAAFTGCRLNELAQLRVDDVCELDSIPALRITDDGDGQSLKTKASARLVPIHSTLVAAGFMAFVENARASGCDALFAHIPEGRNGRRSEAAGKWFRKFLVRLGIKEAGGRGGMHRFRHSVVQKLRDRGHSDAEIALIVGHESRVAPMTSGYGSSRVAILRSQQTILESLKYEGLHLPTASEVSSLGF